MTNSDPTRAHSVSCDLTLSGMEVDSSTGVLGSAGSPSSSLIITLQGAGSTASAGTMTVECVDTSGSAPPATYGLAQLTAIAVGALH